MTTANHPPRALLEEILQAAGDDAPESVEALLALPHIKVFTDALKSSEINGKRAFRCTASSTITDLHGDYMTEACVRDMALQARKGPTGKGLTIFLNHSYNIPEDVAGKVAEAQVLTRAKDDTGADIWDMDYGVTLATHSKRLDEVWNLISVDEITMGISIGAYILEYDFIDKDEGFWGGLIINKVLLVETSIVGIPANQRSWIQNGVISIGENLGFSAKQIRRVLDGKETAPLMKTILAKTIDGREVTVVDDTNTYTKDESGATVVTDSTDTPDTDSVESTDETLEVTADAAPEGEITDEATTEATEDPTDGETTEEVAASDTPALAAVAPEIALSLTDGSTPAVEVVLAALEQAAEMLSAVRTEKTGLEAEVKALTIARDQALKERDFAAEIISIVAKSPLGRKTQFREPIESFKARFAAIYDQDFLNLLDESE